MIIALDPGRASLGMALSENGIIAHRYKTIIFPLDQFKQMYRALEKEIAILKPSKIIIGNPLNMDGSIGERGLFSYECQKHLQALYPKIQIVLWDERWTTKEALHIFKALKLKNVTFKMIKDELAAQIILQSYLNHG